MTTPAAYTVVAPALPVEDRSGAIGVRLLALLSNQAERHVRWVRETTAQRGVRESEFVISDGEGMRWPLHVLYNAATGANATANTIMAEAGGSPKPSKCSRTAQPVIPMLTKFSAAATMLKSMIVNSLPTTISLRWAGLLSSVSRVPRSFSPAQRSTAG